MLKFTVLTVSVAFAFTLAGCGSKVSDARDAGDSLANALFDIPMAVMPDVSGVPDSSDLAATPTWTLGTSRHVAEVDETSRYTLLGFYGNVFLDATETQPENAGYAGSELLVSHTSTGAGEYTLVESPSALALGQQRNPASRLAYVSVTAGMQVEPVAFTKWQSTSGNVTAVLDANGRYHFSTGDVVVLQREYGFGGGVPGAPGQIEFGMSNVHGLTDVTP